MTLFSKIKLYLLLQKANLDCKRVYKFSYYSGIVTLLLNSIAPIITFGVITNHFDTIAGWDFHEILLMYSLWRIGNGLYLTFFHHQINGFDRMLLNGQLDTLLIRPHHPFFMFLCKNFNPDGLGNMLTGILGGMWGFYALQISWSYFLLYFILGLIGGFIITSIFLLISCLSFWTLQSGGIREIASRFNNTFQVYPIDIYNSVIKVILTYVLPFAFTGYYPAQLFLNDAKPTNYLFIVLSPIVAAVMFTLSVTLWNIGIRKYNSSGS